MTSDKAAAAEDELNVSAAHRISGRLKQAVNAERTRSLFGTKLIAVGLTLVCLAGGVDYFEHADQIKLVLTGVARDAGRLDLATAVENVDKNVSDMKRAAFLSLPGVVQRWLAEATFAVGLLVLAGGVLVKLQAGAGDRRPQVIRDVGRVIASPGFVGLFFFAIITWRGAVKVRVSTASFLGKITGGTLTFGELWDLTKSYAPWAWAEVRIVLLMGALLLALSITLHVTRWRLKTPDQRVRLPLGVIDRSAFWGAILCFAYYVLATGITVMTYGSGLYVVTWPWKINPSTFLVALLFMAFGLGLARTGTAEMKRHKALAAAEG